jgi:hypothetical protein
VWRLDDDCTDEANQDMHGDPLLTATLSVWANVECLRHFVHKTIHSRFLNKRADWFSVMAERHLVLWNVDDGHFPSLEEAQARMQHLRAHGDSDYAFGWPAGQTAEQAVIAGKYSSEGGMISAAGGIGNG